MVDNSINKELLNAVIGNNFHTVKRLLENGADPNYFEDEAQIRPLHFAALYNFPNVIPLLIMAGDDLVAHYQIRRHAFNDRQTALSHGGHQRTVPILCGAGTPQQDGAIKLPMPSAVIYEFSNLRDNGALFLYCHLTALIVH